MANIEINKYGYPELLNRLKNPPSLLRTYGNESIINIPFVSVVGARNCSTWVYRWMEHELIPVIKKRGFGILSGGARGVDQASHWLAIRKALPTVIVLPSGIDQLYPKNLSAMQKFENVLFVTEYADDIEMKKHFFYRRNELIAGMSQFLLVIQAAEKSGTMITARAAIDCGSSIGTLPGLPMDSSMSGNNQLLYEGASLIRNARDLEAFLSTMA